ncbi:hypothetical protein AGMMS49991_05340 [Spirochaetia bacterium]|nr:hypothetical protein AGMMS49991_05340 [Spirochaetia bacterium]
MPVTQSSLTPTNRRFDLTPFSLEEAIAQAQAKLADPNRQPFSRHYGAVQGVYGDGMKYQRKMRNEWSGYTVQAI